jgi:alkanesulfonate monooxygenase SsuD/methylene tetrahydromethanopterin reductase-like flavin-dependent oxidoreductase (luciferase family)
MATKLGVIFPQTECGTDIGAIGEFVRAVEAMGADHLFVADHVLGADPRFHSHPSLATYSHEAVVHEALTLMAYLAAITRRLTLATGILILPQRQTALVAKQAAQIDVLSGGRLRLGIGVGWNAVEFEAALRRIAQLADGWSPNFAPDDQGRALVDRVHQYARDAGRNPAALPLEGRVRLAGQGPEGWAKQVAAWKALGTTSIIAEPRNAGLRFPDGHLDVLRRFKDTLKEAS